MSGLRDKTVLITGAGSGVGADMARRFAGQGATVWIAGRRAEALAEVARGHDTIRTHVADITDEAQVAGLFDAAGHPAIVIANAGAAESVPFGKMDRAVWDRMLSVNLTGTFLTLQQGLKRMDKDWGRLIAVASTAGLKGYPYVSAYTAAKHGVVGLVRALALEVARSGVTVNALCPGFLDTEMTARSVANIVEKTDRSPAEARAQLAANNPQGRLIAPSEVTAAALWLCSDGSESINGQAISISGGEI